MKKFISTILVITILISAFSFCIKAEVSAEQMPGDVNLDSKVTAADARLALRASAKLDSLNGLAFIVS